VIADVFPVLVEGERLTLREVEHGDLLAAQALSDHVSRGALGPLDWVTEAMTAAESSPRTRYALAVDHEGEVVGLVSLVVEGDECRGEIGYAVVPEHRRDGIATEAVGLLCRFAFDVVGLRRVFALTAVDNVASTAVLVRAGFVREGRLRSHDGGDVDTYFFGLLVDDDPGAG
jgi:RimJ/RimL family protein N-acetyltransferase